VKALGPSKKQKFEDIVIGSGIQEKRRPSLDVPTRWNSTYQMLHSCIPFADVFDRMKRREDISIEITPEEWDKIKYIHDFLKILNDCKFLLFDIFF
jgi:hypothetical protein